jgi:hypothetical protein
MVNKTGILLAYIFLFTFNSFAAVSQKKMSENNIKITKKFPKREEVLTTDFSHFDNFFPIATIELKEKDSTVQIHIIYTFFQSNNADSKYFPYKEYGGNFSFEIKDGRCQPTFKKEALKIDADYQRFLTEAKEKYSKAAKNYVPLEFLSGPQWWQDDDTPTNKAGKPMKFLCQLDLAAIVDDDCRMFIFYDSLTNSIKTVYQRD